MAMSEQTPSDTDGYPLQLKFNTSGTENEATQVNLDAVGRTKKVSVIFADNAGKVAWETDSDTIHTSFYPCEADNTYQWEINRERPRAKMYVASATASVSVLITFE